MATKFGVGVEYAKYQNPFNLNLMATAMQAKQAKADANRAKIQAQFQALTSLDLVKDGDKEYLENKINAMVDQVNQEYMGADLSSDGVQRSIDNAINSVIDDRIINAAAGSIEVKKMQRQLERMKLNNPEQYNDINAAYALAPAMAWMNDGQVGSKLGSLTYTPYSDYQKHFVDNYERIRKLPRETEIEVQETVEDPKTKKQVPTGRTIKRKVNSMSEQEIIDLAMSGLTNEDRQQLRIEGWYMANSNPNVFSNENVSAYKERSLKPYNDAIAAAQYKIDHPASEEEKKGYELTKANLERRRDDFAQGLDVASSPEERATAVLTHNFANNMAKMYSYNSVSQTMGKDDVALAAIKHQYDLQKEAVKHANALELEAVKAKNKAAASKSSGTTSGEEDSVVRPDGYINILTENKDQNSGADYYNKLYSDSVDAEISSRKALLDYISNDETLNAAYQEALKTKSEDDALQEMFETNQNNELYQNWLNAVYQRNSVSDELGEIMNPAIFDSDQSKAGYKNFVGRDLAGNRQVECSDGTIRTYKQIADEISNNSANYKIDNMAPEDFMKSQYALSFLVQQRATVGEQLGNAAAQIKRAFVPSANPVVETEDGEYYIVNRYKAELPGLLGGASLSGMTDERLAKFISDPKNRQKLFERNLIKKVGKDDYDAYLSAENKSSVGLRYTFLNHDELSFRDRAAFRYWSQKATGKMYDYEAGFTADGQIREDAPAELKEALVRELGRVEDINTWSRSEANTDVINRALTGEDFFARGDRNERNRMNSVINEKKLLNQKRWNEDGGSLATSPIYRKGNTKGAPSATGSNPVVDGFISLYELKKSEGQLGHGVTDKFKTKNVWSASYKPKSLSQTGEVDVYTVTLNTNDHLMDTFDVSRSELESIQGIGPIAFDTPRVKTSTFVSKMNRVIVPGIDNETQDRSGYQYPKLRDIDEAILTRSSDQVFQETVTRLYSYDGLNNLKKAGRETMEGLLKYDDGYYPLLNQFHGQLSGDKNNNLNFSLYYKGQKIGEKALTILGQPYGREFCDDIIPETNRMSDILTRFLQEEYNSFLRQLDINEKKGIKNMTEEEVHTLLAKTMPLALRMYETLNPAVAE